MKGRGWGGMKGGGVSGFNVSQSAQKPFGAINKFYRTYLGRYLSNFLNIYRIKLDLEIDIYGPLKSINRNL